MEDTHTHTHTHTEREREREREREQANRDIRGTKECEIKTKKTTKRRNYHRQFSSLSLFLKAAEPLARTKFVVIWPNAFVESLGRHTYEEAAFVTAN